MQHKDKCLTINFKIVCWTYSKKLGYPQKSIAKSDIITYKIMRRDNGTFSSYFYFYGYKPGTEYMIEDEIKIDETRTKYIVEEGFHSYNGKCLIRTNCVDRSFSLHSYNLNRSCTIWSILRTTEDCDIIVTECLIPKGSVYYENDKGEIVSDKIMITGKAVSINKWIDYKLKRVNIQESFENLSN